jgi:hypothetical protein
MPYFPDLSPCFDEQPKLPHRIAIGWLNPRHPFTTGSFAPELVERIVALCERPEQQAFGFHRCEFCDDGFSNGVIRVTGPAARYVAPQMLAHYVLAHNYQPPAPFLEALLHGPAAPLPPGEPRRWLHLTPQQIADYLRSPVLIEDPRWPSRDTELELIKVLENREFGARWCANVIELLRDPSYASSPDLLLPDDQGLTDEQQAWKMFHSAANRARADAYSQDLIAW